ncbi:lipid-A-disaccharide synthase [Tenacibaculum piscium]|uniref:Lipid-A-disaccharide synthase n=1 Tax=Tenacibaculum piscium TaxID=1458515 RepID=A0A2H1YHS0_9FLAO|nr:lipid-A-disaccharide synthase [Tenacibaculum piscium]MBE7629972.1 lipid-A-disaccharide synthase [Tenacibaculum piscium]MBE7670384.1 lipid-A-disaccharide synthase [Tenacibaculum piscium]MBE7685929.1 lipid-A-disaccharide synthase [Tenacibaculum piscium]MBE7690536.1 lipid-A-disaccharide synthase [Tenacibaculum piscium]SOS75018.1 Lipid-A-disaccharide synthase [Tenacibaculum piscium]
MKYYILVGEASGDLHGANLMKSLLKEDSTAEIRFWGGDLMQEVGGTLVKHYKERAFMGFVEVFLNLKKILGMLSFCKKDIANFKPDVLIFIDNSGFNLRIAKWAKQQGFRTNYYISPQVWASRASRVQDIKRDIDQMFVILPFEKEFYQKYNYEVNFVGHPLIDAIADRKSLNEQDFRTKYQLGDKKIIAILPGSRKQEITKMLSVMLSLVPDFSEYQFVIAGAPSQPFEFYKTFIDTFEARFPEGKKIKFINNKTYDLLSVSHVALVASGTATLETALFKVPQVVCYKGSTISYQIAKRIITLEYISLVNLIMNREVVKELIQNEFTKENLSNELQRILMPDTRQKLLSAYTDLEQKLGGKGASAITAKLIVEGLKEAKN